MMLRTTCAESEFLIFLSSIQVLADKFWCGVNQKGIEFEADSNGHSTQKKKRFKNLNKLTMIFTL